MSPSIEQVCTTLQKLRSGERCWFWYCSDLPINMPRLLLQPLGSDNARQNLKELSENLSVGPRDKTYAGVMSVDSTSTCHFGGANLDKSMIRNLALWVHANHSDNAELSRLCHAQGNLINAAGILSESFHMPSMWSGIQAQYFDETLPDTLTKLQQMQPGDEAFIWMTSQGPNNNPHMCLSLVDEDPQANAFLDMVQRLRLSIRTVGPTIRGVIVINAAGIPFLRTQDDISCAPEIVQSIVNISPSPTLRKLRLAQMIDGVIKNSLSLDPEETKAIIDLSRQSTCLNKLKPERTLFFWFTNADSTGKPLLLLEKDKDRLKELAASARGDGDKLNGKLVLDSKGRAEFRSRKTMPNFITILASWAIEHAPAWPSLQKLRDARLICKDAEGKTIDRQKNSDAWTNL